MALNFIEVDNGKFEIRQSMKSTLDGVGPIYERDLEAARELDKEEHPELYDN